MSERKRQRYLRILKKYAKEECDVVNCDNPRCPACLASRTLEDIDDLVKRTVGKLGRIEIDSTKNR